MANANRGLGRGLGALLGDAALQTESADSLYLPISQVESCAGQPRKHFDAGALQELAESIRQYGVLQPLTVRRLAGGYELVAGERRLRAARLAGLSEVPCLLADVDEESSGMLALVENLQRRDLDYIEEAEGLQKLMQQYHLSQEQAARRIGKSQSAVANKLRILRHITHKHRIRCQQTDAYVAEHLPQLVNHPGVTVINYARSTLCQMPVKLL